MSIRDLLFPKSVAVVGASAKPVSVGRIIVENLLRLGYDGRVYPVNPKYREVLGLACYRSVVEVPEEIDVAVVAVPAPAVPGVIRECGVKGVKYAVVISSGFGELGGQGRKLEEEMLRYAREYGVRIVGPNTTGILNLNNGFTSVFTRIPREVRRGNVSLVVQTGVFAASLLRWIITGEMFGLSKVIGLGNKVDVDEVEALELLGDDPDTRVILMYLEGVKRGREFLSVARRVSKDKPIVLVKAGRTPSGRRAALSHTGSVAGEDHIFEAACRQARIVRAGDFDEALEYVKTFSFLNRPRGRRVAVASYSGAGCVIAADYVEMCGLELAPLSADTIDRISRLAPHYWPRSHPIDLGPILESEGAHENLPRSLEILLADDAVDMAVIVLPVLAEGEEAIMWESGSNVEELARTFKELKVKYPEKPLILVVNGSKDAVEQARMAVEAVGIPVFYSISRGFRALSRLYYWSLGGCA